MNHYCLKENLACDLFSLRCGVLTAEIILNSTCFETRYYMGNSNANEVYVYVDSSSSWGIEFVNHSLKASDHSEFGGLMILVI